MSVCSLSVALVEQVTRPGHFHKLSPPPLGHYDTPHALYEALRNPTMNYTVLVPPSESLAFLPKALGHGLMTHAQALSILMLHIIPGRFGARDLTLAANDGQYAFSLATLPCMQLAGKTLCSFRLGAMCTPISMKYVLLVFHSVQSTRSNLRTELEVACTSGCFEQ